jgi:hypothetical protein
MQRHDRLDAASLLGVQVSAADEVLGQWPRLVASTREARPRAGLGRSGRWQGEQAEEPITVGGDGGH